MFCRNVLNVVFCVLVILKSTEFESNIGDLQSIVKVEKRRSAVLEKIKEFEGKETAQLVERYKFLDLYPCTAAELRSIGYTDIMNATTLTKKTNQPLLLLHADEEQPLPKPDISQMIPYKPKTNALFGEHPVPGGMFPHPPAAAYLCMLLPPPGCFRGPFVNVDMLMDVFGRIQLPDTAPVPVPENGCDTKLFDLAKSVHWIVDDSNLNANNVALNASSNSGAQISVVSKRRRRIGLTLDGSDDEETPLPPSNDIYRQRQQKKVKS